MSRLGRWVDERLGIFELSRAFLDRKVPGNINWFHTLGSATLILIGVQFLTGIALSMSYVPSPDHAYESVLYIDQTPFGAIDPSHPPCLGRLAGPARGAARPARLHLGCAQVPA